MNMRKICLIMIIACASCCGSTWAQRPSDAARNLDGETLVNAADSVPAVEMAKLRDELERQNVRIDSLQRELEAAGNAAARRADSLSVDVASSRREFQDKTDSIHHSVESKWSWGVVIMSALALVLILIAFIYGRLIARRGVEISTLAAKAEELNEEIVARMSRELVEMESISTQLAALVPVSGADSDAERSLIKTLADRITFMEMTLYRMDSSVRGHKQLSKSIRQMKDNLMANGYELVDMLGKDYHDGMRVTANFVEDEDLPEGKQIITGIIKPQINYKGEMIQSAQITVSQNI